MTHVAFTTDESGTRRFKCACGSERCERVRVRKASGNPYETEFASCYWCSTMYFAPFELPVFVPTQNGYPVAVTVGQPSMGQADLAEVRATAARVEKSKGRR